MQTDAEILSAVPDFISFGSLLKSTPVEENGERYLFIEASNEDVDHSNEVVLQKALVESKDYYLRHGNIDLSHYTILGPKVAGENFLQFEVGKPVDVRLSGKRTFVKALLYSGDSPQAKNADMVWSSLTKQSPPSRWYPSVGGAVLSKSVRIDPVTHERVAVVDKVRWNNIALDRCPVNKTVPEVSTIPVGIFAKSLGGYVLSKTLTAGYGTDSASLTGGGALRIQSLHGSVISYEDFRESFRNEVIRSGNSWKGARELAALAARQFGVSRRQAAEWVGRLLRDLKNQRS